MNRKRINEIKRMTEGELRRQGITFAKLTARTVDYVDLARDHCVFVKLHGLPWAEPRFSGGKGTQALAGIKAFARENGFHVENT